MKKLTLLLIAVGISTFGANAKVARHRVVDASATTRNTADPGALVEGSVPSLLMDPQVAHAAKATNAVIGTVETFGSGTATTMPTGWTTVNLTNTEKFKWHDTSAAVNAIPKVVGSPSRGDGYMIIDAFSNSANPAHATLTSPAYNMTGHAHVGLVFNEWFERFRDSMWVEVTNNNFSSSTTFPIYLNTTLANNALTRNTDTFVMDISSVAANAASVKIRFHYSSTTQSYGWAIDDVRFVDLDAVNMKLHRSALMYAVDTVSPNNFWWGVGTIPKQFLTTTDPLSFLYNQGYNAQPAVNVNATITGGAPAYNHDVSVSLAVNGYDSSADFGANFYNPTASAVYSCVFTATGTTDTTKFEISDTSWTNYSPANISRGAYYLHRPSTHAAGEHSWNRGTRLFVPGGKADTLTSINGMFYYTTTPGVKVLFQVYKFSTVTSAWELFGQCFSRALQTYDISPQGTPTYSENFYPDPVFNGGPIILSGDVNDGFTQYAVVATTDHNAPTDETVLYVSNAAQFTGYFGVSGLEDSSDNLGTESFAYNVANTTNHTPWAFEYAPMIRVNFGTIVGVGVSDVATVISSDKVYPNPANNTVDVTFSLANAANTSVTLQNMVGQVLKTQNTGVLKGQQQGKATFATNDLANGIYFYTINAGAERKTGRFVVSH